MYADRPIRWGIAINTAVTLVVFPISSEKELRKSLVHSLQHVSKLCGPGWGVSLNKVVDRNFRNARCQIVLAHNQRGRKGATRRTRADDQGMLNYCLMTIGSKCICVRFQADFGRLTQKLEETTLEINWSK